MLVRVHVSLSCFHAPTSYQLSISSGGRQKGASLKTAQAKETPGDGAKKEIAESTAPKVDAVEVQVTSDRIFWFCFWQNATLQRHAAFFVMHFVLAERHTAATLTA